MIDREFQRTINRELKSFFARKRELTLSFDERTAQLVDQMADMTLRGGDRLRPYMCLLGYQAVGGNGVQGIMPLLLALELFHTFALIHDDIMDEAETRRGGPTIHAYFTQNLRNHHLAVSLAILAGDWCLNWAHELLDAVVSKPAVSGAKELFDSMVDEVIMGQTSDVWGMKERETSALLAMYRAKSGNYAVTRPLLMGAVCGGADKVALRQLKRYGQAVGLAFQLKDDLLGVFGDEKRLGKSVSGDITEGKWTLVVAWAYEQLGAADREKLMRILGNRQASDRHIEWVKEQLVTTGAKKKTEEKTQSLVVEALKSLHGTSLKNRRTLAELAHFIVNRTV